MEIRLFLAALQRFKVGQNPLYLTVSLAMCAGNKDGAKDHGRIYYVTDLMKSLENYGKSLKVKKSLKNRTAISEESKYCTDF